MPASSRAGDGAHALVLAPALTQLPEASTTPRSSRSSTPAARRRSRSARRVRSDQQHRRGDARRAMREQRCWSSRPSGPDGRRRGAYALRPRSRAASASALGGRRSGEDPTVPVQTDCPEPRVLLRARRPASFNARVREPLRRGRKVPRHRDTGGARTGLLQRDRRGAQHGRRRSARPSRDRRVMRRHGLTPAIAAA